MVPRDCRAAGPGPPAPHELRRGGGRDNRPDTGAAGRRRRKGGRRRPNTLLALCAAQSGARQARTSHAVAARTTDVACVPPFAVCLQRDLCCVGCAGCATNDRDCPVCFQIKILAVKNRFGQPTDMGYRDCMFKIIFMEVRQPPSCRALRPGAAPSVWGGKACGTFTRSAGVLCECYVASLARRGARGVVPVPVLSPGPEAAPPARHCPLPCADMRAPRCAPCPRRTATSTSSRSSSCTRSCTSS